MIETDSKGAVVHHGIIQSLDASVSILLTSESGDSEALRLATNVKLDIGVALSEGAAKVLDLRPLRVKGDISNIYSGSDDSGSGRASSSLLSLEALLLSVIADENLATVDRCVCQGIDGDLRLIICFEFDNGTASRAALSVHQGVCVKYVSSRSHVILHGLPRRLVSKVTNKDSVALGNGLARGTARSSSASTLPRG